MVEHDGVGRSDDCCPALVDLPIAVCALCSIFERQRIGWIDE
jgi:hypothetical protein